MKKNPTTLLFGVTIFISSALLFSIQPMIAKMLLPLLGGTPAVWNTCMVFFQAALLCGYAYALMVSRWSLKRQLIVQLAVLSLAFISLPIGLSSSWVNSVPSGDNPSLWLLLCLAASVGLPFFIVSSNSPLLQKWFSRTATESARDPYFLYSASNAGSLLALLAYPALLEPFFTLRAQGRLWTVVYAVLVLLIALHALLLWRSKSLAPEPVPNEAEEIETAKPTLNRRLRWLLLAFAPSSLMLGVTNYITTDVASVPLLWIIPLALYLLTMIFAFARKPLFSSQLTNLVVPGATVVLLMLYLADTAGRGSNLLMVLHLGYFFFAALMCHSQLAGDRPGPRYLAEFYVWLSMGGVLGGIFNALVAPMVFSSVVEYPLAILLSCLLLPNRDTTKRWGLDFALPALVFALTVGLGWMADKVAPIHMSGSVFVVAIPLSVSYPLRKRPLRFALTLGAIILAASLVTGVGRRTLHSERNFFGVLKVVGDQNLNLHSFLHGSTVHGKQSTIPEKRCEPLSYYHREGPFARIITQFQSSHAQANIGIIGLGAGGTLSYSRPTERWTFYEINPAVVSIARSREYFSYISDCAAAPVDVVLGDARLKLHEAPDRVYDLLVLDAFSSDAIPIHLITQQALDLYLSKVKPGGLIVFHISNRNLDLSEVVADLAKSRDLSCLSMLEMVPPGTQLKTSSHWVVLARNSADYGNLANDSLAKPLLSSGGREVWTDDFSNILSVFKWGKSK